MEHARRCAIGPEPRRRERAAARSEASGGRASSRPHRPVALFHRFTPQASKRWNSPAARLGRSALDVAPRGLRGRSTVPVPSPWNAGTRRPPRNQPGTASPRTCCRANRGATRSAWRSVSSFHAQGVETVKQSGGMSPAFALASIRAQTMRL